MSGGAGHAIDAIIRMRNNRALKSIRKKFKSSSQYSNINTDDKRKIKKVSDEELQQFIAKIKIKKQKEKRKERIVFIVVAIVFVLIVFYLM